MSTRYKSVLPLKRKEKKKGKKKKEERKKERKVLAVTDFS
jgi:hypothetical protein